MFTFFYSVVILKMLFYSREKGEISLPHKTLQHIGWCVQLEPSLDLRQRGFNQFFHVSGVSLTVQPL